MTLPPSVTERSGRCNSDDRWFYLHLGGGGVICYGAEGKGSYLKGAPEPSVMKPRVKFLIWRVELEPSEMGATVKVLTWRVDLEPSHL